MKQGPDEGKGVADLANNGQTQQSKRSVWGRMIDNVYSLFGSKSAGESKPTEEVKGMRNTIEETATPPTPRTKVSKTPDEISADLDQMVAFAKAGKIDKASEFYNKYLGELGMDPSCQSQQSGEDNPVRDVAMKRLQELAGGFEAEDIWSYLIRLRDGVTSERLKGTRSLEARINGGLGESKYVLVFSGDKAYILASGCSYHSMEVNCFKRTFDSAEEADKVHIAWGGKIAIGADKVTLYSSSTAYGEPSEQLLAELAPMMRAAFKLPVAGGAYHSSLNRV